MDVDQAPSSEQRIPKITKLRIIKNLVSISLSFFLLFTAYDGLSMLQSSMNKESGIGVISQAVLYISFSISAVLFPKYVIRKHGCKSSLILSITCYLPYIAANFYPKWYIMIPSGICIGIGAAILWGSNSTYFNESAVRYAQLITDESLNRSQSPDIPSNCTSVEILADRNSKSEIIEENTLKELSSVNEKSEESAVKYKCKNPSCENVEEFFVSEIEINRVQILKNTEDNRNTPQTEVKRKPDHSENLSLTDTSSPVQTHKRERGKIKEDLQNEGNVSKVEEIAKTEAVQSVEFASPKRNPHHKPIFQKANTLESVTGLFFGCHGMAYYLAQICSNVILYYVLKGDEDVSPVRNSGGCSCGAQFCNDDTRCINEDTEFVSRKMRFLLTGICVVIASISVLLVFFFVDPLKKAKPEDEPEKISLRLVSATFSQHKKKEQLCLIPISFFKGLQQGFYTADFTKSYVVCAWSASNVGLVSIFYGSTCVISSLTSGFLVKYIGRMPLFLTAQVITISMVIFLMLWQPDSDTPYKFYIASTFFGIITGIYWSQLLAFYGLLFKKDEEAAFASYNLCSSLGWTTSFLTSNLLCTYVKIYLLLAVSIIGTTGYVFTERSYAFRKQQGTVASP